MTKTTLSMRKGTPTSTNSPPGPQTCHSWPFLAVLGSLVFGVAVTSGCRRQDAVPPSPSPSVTAEPWFEEVSERIGIDFTHVPYAVHRFYFPEIMTGGVGLLDYNGDGYLDVYLVQAGDLDPSTPNKPGNQLYRNRGDGTFEDVTAKAGVGDSGYGMGCTCGDFDNDGDTDLYVTNVGPNVLYRNNGDGTFTDVTIAAGVGDPTWSASSAFVDYDGDGFLDLFVVNYINWSPSRELECKGVADRQDYCIPTNYRAPAPDRLYRNNRDGTFTDATQPAGISEAFGNGLGVACGDFNGDGRTDIYVTNDVTPNQLWINNAQGQFTDEGLLQGCALSGTGAVEAGMGVMAIDIENDGDLDLSMAHFRNESNTFYLNTKGMFEDVTAQLGLSTPSLPFTGFGLGFADFDHDRLLDLFIANGRVTLFEPILDQEKPYSEPNLLLQGLANLRFEELLPRGGTVTPLIDSSRGAAFGDLDNDGDIDIVVMNFKAKTHVLRNIVGSRGAWITFRVLNRRGSHAIGASVRIESNQRIQWRTVQVAYSYCASNDPRIHFGLGNAPSVDSVLVRWPHGPEETFGPFEANAFHVLQEGSGQTR